MLMKKASTLLMALGFTMAVTVSAQAETETDYVVGFDQEINTSSHNFKVADGWGHIVDYFSSEDRYGSPYDYYVKYTYEADNGLKIDNQKVGPDWSASEQQDVYDLLVTPVVSGNVTLSVKQFNYNGYVEFYTIKNNAKGELIGTQHKSDLSTDDYTEITLSITEPQKIGIRASRVYINNFSADNATIEPNKLMTVVSARSNGAVSDNSNGGTSGLIKWPADPTHKNANGDDMIKVSYMVTVKNTCNVKLTAGDENYSVSIINSKLENPVIVTVPVPQDLEPDATSDPFEVTGYVNPYVDYNTSKDYPTPWGYANDSQPFNIKENLDGTILNLANGGFVPYKHEYVFRTLGSSSTSKYTSPISFGMISEEATQNFEIYNNGVAPLTVTAISVDAPFTVAHSDNLTINNQEQITVDVTFPATASGSYSGNLNITYIDNNGSEKTETYAVSGTMLGANTWSAPFDDGTSYSIIWPEGSLAESNVNSDWTGKNYYLKCTSAGTNKFFTPLLHANAGDSMSFMAKRYSTTHSIKVYLASSRSSSTLGEPVATITDLTGDWKMQTINIAQEGDYYVVFELYNVYVDDIVGLTKVDVAHDLYVKDLGNFISTEYQSGEDITKQVNIIPVLGEKAANYTVQVILGDEVAATVDSKDLTAHAKNATQFSATFNKTVTATTKLDYYWKFSFADGTPAIESDHTELTITCEPKFCFVTKGTSDGKNAPSNKTSHNFGKVNETNLTAQYEIFNWGKGALTINSVTLPDGFSTTFTAPATIAGKEHVDFPVIFSATGIGIYSGDIVINYVDADGESKDFKFAVSGTLLDPTKFYAPFMSNNNSDYPAGSVRDSNVSISYKSGASGNYALYGSNTSTTENNLFVTPLLHAEANEAINFDAILYSSAWDEGIVKVYAASTRNDLHNEATRTTLLEIKGKDVEDEANLIPADAFKTFSATIAEAGDYYIGFDIFGRAYVDEIYGLSLVAVDHDLELAGSSVPATVMQNNVANATVQLRNFGFAAEEAGSYSATVSVNGVETEVTDLPEIPVMFKSNDTPVSISVPFRYGKVGTFPVSVKVQFGHYTIETDPTDVEFTEEVLSSEKQVGEFKELNTVPFHTNYKQVETLALYTPEELGLNGGDVINNITLRGYFNEAHSSDVTIAYAWVDETTLAKPEVNSKYDTSEMTVIYEQEGFAWPGGGSKNDIIDLFTLNFNGATYTEGKSLLLFFGSYTTGAYHSAAKSELSTTSKNCWYRQNDTNLTNASWGAKNLPVLHIGLAVEPKTISGTVTGPDDAAVEGATVTLTATDGSGVEYTGTTAADGAYEISVIQTSRTYNIIAKSGDLEDYATNVTFEESVVKDFKLGTAAVHIHTAATGVESVENARVRFNLELTPGYHALALPFAVDQSMVATLFGADAEIYTLTGTDLTDGELISYFDPATSVAAGEPFVVNVTETIDEIINGVTLVAEPQVGGQSSAHITFSASYEPTSADGKFTFDDSNFVVLDDARAARFGRAMAQQQDVIPAFHATAQARPGQQIDNLSFAVEQTPTGINEISVKFPEGKAYNLRGMRTLNPANGVYIINGKKVLVK